MQIEILKSKIHRVTVTGADLNYIGSITIDRTNRGCKSGPGRESSNCKHQ